MNYMVTFPETQHPVLRKLREFRESKEVAWFYGCYRSGKTSLIGQVFQPELIFNYPTEPFQRVAGNINHCHDDNDPPREEYSPFLRRWPQFSSFLDAYISWTDNMLQLAVPGARTATANLLASRDFLNIVRNLIAYHQTADQNILGSITWLVQVNILDAEDREFVDLLSEIHLSIVKSDKNSAPNLIFESWFPDGSSRNFPKTQSDSPPKTRPARGTRRKQIGSVRTRKNIKQSVRWQVSDHNGQSGHSSSVTDVYNRALQKHLCDMWDDLRNNPTALQTVSNVVKNWAGFHFGSIDFILSALTEEMNTVSFAVEADVLEMILENYIESHDSGFRNLLEDMSLSLEIGRCVDNGTVVLDAWNVDEIEKQKRNLWDAGINIAENAEEEVQLIKLVQHFRRRYPQDDIELDIPSDTEMSCQFIETVDFLAGWVSQTNPSPSFDNSFKAFVISSPQYNEENQQRLELGISRFLRANGTVRNEDLFTSFYQPFVQNYYRVYENRIASQDGMSSICEEIVRSAVVAMRLCELVTEIKNYRSMLRND